MQLMHHVRGLSHGFNNVIGESGRMRRGEAYTLEPINRAASTQQFAEGVAVTDAISEGIHVLPEQGDFLGAVGHALAHFVKNVSRTAILFLASRGRDDAERAGVVAAHGNRHPRTHAGSPGRRQLAWELLKLVIDLDLRSIGGTVLVEQLRQVADVLGAEYRSDPWRLIGDFLAVKLSHAPANGNLQVRALTLHLRPQAHRAIHAFGSVLTHRTGVEHNEIEVMVIDLFLGGRHITICLEHAGNALGIMHIHLTTEGMDVEHALAAFLCCKVLIGFNRGALRLGHHVFVHNVRFYRPGSS